ncbi:hypothetical protein [Frigoribacterium sp. 9N]|uniref:hypothetical protein n=1 Tax=Frigoribacterium sp. 9N TaxID=2653144 RepID=UPI0012F2575D|nr:hypothetical protein [Frigoribacterium sp. 9N]VXB72292.1 hypothetical protein FRIGORI9N_400118 [Frigoribacterium sp. 9N]
MTAHDTQLTISTTQLLQRDGWTRYKIEKELTGKGKLVPLDTFGRPQRWYDVRDIEVVEANEEWTQWRTKVRAKQERALPSELVHIHIRDRETRLFVQHKRAKWVPASKSWLVPGKHVAEARVRAATFDPAEPAEPAPHSFRK